MPQIKKKNLKTLKFILISAILLISVVIAAVYIGYRRISNKKIDVVSVLQTKANISIGKFHHTATSNGIKEWTIDARTAQVINAKKQAVLQDLSVTFFLKNNAKVYLTANRGILSTDSNDIEVSGNVVVQNENYRLKTETLHYKDKRRVLFSKVPVKITSRTSQLTADSMTYDLNTSKTVLKGNIDGFFSENIAL